MSANATESYGKPSLQLRTSVDHSIRVTSGARDVRDSRTKEATRPPVLSGNEISVDRLGLCRPLCAGDRCLGVVQTISQRLEISVIRRSATEYGELAHA